MPPVTMHGIDNRFTLQGFSPKKFVFCQGCDCINKTLGAALCNRHVCAVQMDGTESR